MSPALPSQSIPSPARHPGLPATAVRLGLLILLLYGFLVSIGLLSTAAGRTEDDRAKLKAVGNAMEHNGIIETLGTFVARWFTDAFIEAHPETIEARLQQVFADAQP